MNTTPAVSVVIPVYNGQRFLAATIDSVLNQSWKDLEVVVVDDGSTDRTPEILASYGDGIRVHRQANRGVAAARNAGVAASRGRYIAFLDADDVWLREKLTLQMERFVNADVGLVYSGVTVVDENLVPLYDSRVPDPEDVVRRTLLVEPEPVPLTMTGVVPRECFEQLGGFDEELSTSADADFVVRLALRYRMAAVHEPLALYRQHAQQMHLNLAAMERDMARVHDKFFADPRAAPYLSLRRSAAASVHYTLAICYAREGKPTRALSSAFTSLRADPLRVWRLFRRGVARHRGQRSRLDPHSHTGARSVMTVTDDFTRRGRLDDVGRWFINRFVVAAAERIPAGSRLLDAGAGEGAYRRYFAHCEYKTADLGVGDPAWNYAHLDYVAPLHQLPIDDGTFDVVLCTQALEHLELPRESVHEMARVLRKGGTLYLTAPMAHELHQEPYDFFRYTSHGLRSICSSAGFEQIEIVPFGGIFARWAYEVPRVLNLFPPTGFTTRRFHWRGVAMLPIRLPVMLLVKLVPPLLLALDRYDTLRKDPLGWGVIARK